MADWICHFSMEFMAQFIGDKVKVQGRKYTKRKYAFTTLEKRNKSPKDKNWSHEKTSSRNWSENWTAKRAFFSNVCLISTFYFRPLFWNPGCRWISRVVIKNKATEYTWVSGWKLARNKPLKWQTFTLELFACTFHKKKLCVQVNPQKVLCAIDKDR